jgi:hypothetical protein
MPPPFFGLLLHILEKDFPTIYGKQCILLFTRRCEILESHKDYRAFEFV